ncbi:unnamed protein product [Closterium sp. NIES-64]|nr:unnamed protein product [Closterium sp. NIES-64]
MLRVSIPSDALACRPLRSLHSTPVAISNRNVGRGCDAAILHQSRPRSFATSGAPTSLQPSNRRHSRRLLPALSSSVVAVPLPVSGLSPSSILRAPTASLTGLSTRGRSLFTSELPSLSKSRRDERKLGIAPVGDVWRVRAQGIAGNAGASVAEVVEAETEGREGVGGAEEEKAEKLQYVPLHTHSDFSLLDGASQGLVARAKELNMPGIALTDHGVMYGALQLVRMCEAEGLKPVIGNEMYLVHDKGAPAALLQAARALREQEEQGEQGEMREEREESGMGMRMGGAEGEADGGGGQVVLERVGEVGGSVKGSGSGEGEMGQGLGGEVAEGLAGEEQAGEAEAVGAGKAVKAPPIPPDCSVLAKDMEGYRNLVPLLLAKDMEGYRNLVQLTSISHLHGMVGNGARGRPCITRELLAHHRKGLVVLSGCMSGEVPRAIMADRMDEARSTVDWYQSVFGSDYYLEVMDHGRIDFGSGYDVNAKINRALLHLSQQTGVPLVATNDSHFTRAADHRAHQTLVSVKAGKNLVQAYTGQEYVKSPEEMLESLQRTLPEDQALEALQNSLRIADKVTSYSADLFSSKPKLPTFDVPPGHTDASWLESEAWRGLQAVMGVHTWEAVPQQYRERLDLELRVICNYGLSAYFLVCPLFLLQLRLLLLADIIQFARKNDIPVGPGRGSAAGSLVAYALEIISIDPIEHGLYFERFLNEERLAPPDIDSDFCPLGRDKILAYIAEKYGAHRVAQIATFNRMGSRAVLKDVGRDMQIPLNIMNELTKLVPVERGKAVSLKTLMAEDTPFRRRVERDGMLLQCVELGQLLEGTNRSFGVHAAGIIISPACFPLSQVSQLHSSPSPRSVSCTLPPLPGQSAALFPLSQVSQLHSSPSPRSVSCTLPPLPGQSAALFPLSQVSQLHSSPSPRSVSCTLPPLPGQSAALFPLSQVSQLHSSPSPRSVSCTLPPLPGQSAALFPLSQVSQLHSSPSPRSVSCTLPPLPGQSAALFPLSQVVPVQHAPGNPSALVSQYAMDDVERLGLLKFDILGLRNLTTAHLARLLAQRTYGVTLPVIEKLPVENRATFELLSGGDVDGVFQLEASPGMKKVVRALKPSCLADIFAILEASPGMKKVVRALKPSRLADIFAIVALYRPGPLDAGLVDRYMNRKHGREPVSFQTPKLEPILKETYGVLLYQEQIMRMARDLAGPLDAGLVDRYINRKHGREPVSFQTPKLEPILKETYGVLLYQEQIMRMARDLAGYSLGQADMLRRAMGKKKQEEMVAHHERFVEGAVERGVERAVAEDLFEQMVKFSQYCFNKSHSAAYGYLTYVTAFLKANYPLPYMAALLSTSMLEPPTLRRYVNSCRAAHINILPPSVNASAYDFSVELLKTGMEGGEEREEGFGQVSPSGPATSAADGGIRFGLAGIRDVSRAAAEEIIGKREAGGRFVSIQDLVDRIDLGMWKRPTIHALAHSGALDCLILREGDGGGGGYRGGEGGRVGSEGVMGEVGEGDGVRGGAREAEGVEGGERGGDVGEEVYVDRKGLAELLEGLVKGRKERIKAEIKAVARRERELVMQQRREEKQREKAAKELQRQQERQAREEKKERERVERERKREQQRIEREQKKLLQGKGRASKVEAAVVLGDVPLVADAAESSNYAGASSGTSSSTDSFDPALILRRPLQEEEMVERLAQEKALLGFYVTQHPVEALLPSLPTWLSLTPLASCAHVGLTKALEDSAAASASAAAKGGGRRGKAGGGRGKGGKDGPSVAVVAMVEAVNVRMTKNSNKQMANLQLDDGTGQLEAVVFPDVFARYGSSLSKGATVLAWCTVDVELDDSPAAAGSGDSSSSSSSSSSKGEGSADGATGQESLSSSAAAGAESDAEAQDDTSPGHTLSLATPSLNRVQLVVQAAVPTSTAQFVRIDVTEQEAGDPEHVHALRSTIQQVRRDADNRHEARVMQQDVQRDVEPQVQHWVRKHRAGAPGAVPLVFRVWPDTDAMPREIVAKKGSTPYGEWAGEGWGGSGWGGGKREGEELRRERESRKPKHLIRSDEVFFVEDAERAVEELGYAGYRARVVPILSHECREKRREEGLCGYDEQLVE